MRRNAREFVALSCLALVALTGCATFSEDGGFETVQVETKSSLDLEAHWLRDDAAREAARARIAPMLEQQLSSTSVMQIALLSNPRLQAEYANLGISEADLVQAGRLPNPGFSFGKTSGGGAQEIERGLHFNILSILTMPVRTGIEHRRFQAARLAAAAVTLEVAYETRAAFFEAVAAQEKTRYFEQVLEAALASRELMTRMNRVGNSSKLDLAREELFHAQASTALVRAKQSEVAARESLIRMLGLWGEKTRIKLPDRLPDLPAQAEEIADIEQRAINERLDIQQAKLALAGLASNLGLTQTTRFINVLEAGPAQVRERGEPVRDGYEISLEIPLFDWGGAKVARAQALYTQASEHLRATAIGARSQVRQAYIDYRSAYDIALHYRDVIVPLRKQISDEQLLRYNGMLISVFELISDARDQVNSITAYLDALRTFWLADNALKSAMRIGMAPVPSNVSAALPAGGDAAGH